MRKKTLAITFASVTLLSWQQLLLSDSNCDEFYSQWMAIGHREGKGIGYSDGYTTLSTFLVAQKDFLYFCPFMDLRWHLFNHGRSAGNLGLGARTFLDGWDAIAGVSLFYDFRETRKKTYHQMGIGVEWFSGCWDFLANGYMPVGPQKSHYYGRSTSMICDSSFSGFQGHQALIGSSTLHISRKREYDFSGFDALMRRTLLDNGTFSFDAGVGSYFFFGEYRKNIYGGSFKLTANVLDYVVLRGEVNYDSVFRTTVNAQLSIQIPFGSSTYCKPHGCTPCEILQRKLVRRVERNEIIPVKIEKSSLDIQEAQAIALKPNGDSFNLIFVNNLNASMGDGTVENPFSRLEFAEIDSQPGDIIYVFQGDGTSSGMDQGFILKDNQQLIGSGNRFTLVSLCGPINISAQTGGAPVITNLSGDGLTLANNNIVNGLFIFNPLNRGIFGDGIETTSLSNNTVWDPVSIRGIELINCNGELAIFSNGIYSNSSSPTLDDAGIFIREDGGIADILVLNNTIQNYSAGIRIQELNGSLVNARVEGNTLIAPDSYGIDISSLNGSFSTTLVNGNSIQAGNEVGISITSGIDCFREGIVSGNSINNCLAEGMLLGVADGGFFKANVNNNSLLGNGGGSLPGFVAETSFSATPGDRLCLILTDNTCDTGYLLHNFSVSGTTFNLEPLVGNSGTVTEVGAITNVPQGFCNE